MFTYDLKSEGAKPMYLKLYELIREDIRSGAIPAGSRLPSKRTMAERLGVSVVTVDGAYKCLEDEGYVTSRERSGYFAAPLPPGGESASALPRMLPEEPAETGRDMGFRYSALTKIMRKVITEYGERLLAKPPAFGCAVLRNAIARYLLRSRGMRVEPGRIVVGSGAEYLYGMLVQLLGRDKLFGVEDPGYEKIRRVYSACGAGVELLRLDGEGISPEALTASRAGILHVTPYHSYPTGVTATAERRSEYLKWASRRGGLIIEDDFDSEFALTRKPLEPLYSMDREGRVIYLNTFSHSLASSMRMGYMVLPESLYREYELRLGFYACPVPVFDQYVLAEFIDSGCFERHINRVRRRLRTQSRHTDE